MNDPGSDAGPAPPAEAGMTEQGVPTPPGRLSCEIEHDIQLVREVITLSFPWKLQHTVLPGTLGVHCFKGRLRDAEGRPHLYPAGTTVLYQPFAAPPWSDAEQQVIVVSQGAQRAKLSLRCPLPGLGAEPLTLTAVIRFQVTDPLRLIERTPGWERPGALERLNAAVARDLRDAIEGVLRPLVGPVTANPEWLTPAGWGRLRELIASGIDLSDRGLSLVGDQAPLAGVEYPDQLLRALRELHTAYVLWRQRYAAADEEQRRTMGAALGLEGELPPLEELPRRPELLEAVMAQAGGQVREHAELLRRLLRQEGSGEFYGGLVAGLLRELRGRARGEWGSAGVPPA